MPTALMLYDLKTILAGTDATTSQSSHHLLSFACAVLEQSGGFYVSLWPIYACLRPALLRPDSSDDASVFLCCNVLLRIVHYTSPDPTRNSKEPAMTADEMRTAEAMGRDAVRVATAVTGNLSRYELSCSDLIYLTNSKLQAQGIEQRISDKPCHLG
jgi:hypothetical protein